MSLDLGDLFGFEVEVTSGSFTPVYLGAKGFGTNNSIRFMFTIKEDIVGLTKARWVVYTADDEEGTTNKKELVSTPVFTTDELSAGTKYSVIIPATNQSYALLEMDATGTATAGKVTAALTTAEQDSWHNQ